MQAVLTIALNDLRIFFAERGNVFGLVVLPLAFTLVLGWAFSADGEGTRHVRVDVIDEDSSPQSARLLADLRAANSTLVLCPLDNGENDFCRLDGRPLTLARGKERAQSEITRALIVVPSGYREALLNFGQTELDFYAAGDVNLPNAVEQTITAVLQRVNTAALTAGVTGQLLDRLGEQTGLASWIAPFRDEFLQDVYADARDRIEARPAAVRYELSRSQAGQDATVSGVDSGFGQSVPGMGSMYVLFTVLGGVAVLLRERRQWTLQRLVVLPVTRSQILGGKVLTYFTLGILQFLLVFAVGLFVGLDFGERPLLLLPVMAAFALCATGLAFAVAPFVSSEEQANGITRLLSLSLAPLGGAWWPLEIVPDFMRTIGYLSPVAWAMQAFHDLMWENGVFIDILPEIGVLLGASAVFFIIGVTRFRYDA